MDCSLPGSSIHGVRTRQEYWSELTFPTAGDFPNPGIKPVSLALQMDSLPGKLMPAHNYVQKQEEK